MTGHLQLVHVLNSPMAVLVETDSRLVERGPSANADGVPERNVRGRKGGWAGNKNEELV